MSQDVFKNLDKIVESATRLSLLEAFGIEDEERAKQDELEDELKDLKSGGKKSKKDEVEEGEETPPEGEAGAEETGDTDTPTPTTPTVEDVVDATVDDIVDKLNMLRSGKSTKDNEVRDQLASYWDGLQPGEKQSLYAYLTGLTQIMTAGAVGADATDPSSVGIKISAKKKSKAQAEKEEPAKDLASDQDEEEPEEGSHAAPIIVGEVARKRNLLRRVRELMR